MMGIARRVSVVVLALVACCALLAAAPQWSVGDGSKQWFIRSVPADADGPARWTIAARNGKQIVDVTSAGREPAQFATFGGRLAVLSIDGGWSLASDDGVVAGPALPDGKTPLAIATGRGLLWFLTGHGDARALVTWDGRSFADAGKVPDVQPPAADARLLVTHGSVIVASRVLDGIQVIAKDDAGWHTADAPIAADAAWLAQDERRGPLAILRAGNAWTVRTIARDGTLGAPATLPADGVPTSASPAVVDGDVRIAWTDGEQIVEQAFDATNHAVGPPLRTRPTASANAQVPSTFDRVASWLGMAAIGVLLLTAGRSREATPAPARGDVAAALLPASLARRLAAGLIDAWPLYVACAVVVLTSDRPEAEMIRLDAPHDRMIVVAGSIAYTLVGLLCEWRWQRTLGKLLVGLRVVNENGERPAVRAILIRNVLRLLDLNLITLLIVPFSRQRQRLGDLVAGTIVVEAATAPAATPAEPKSADEKR